MQPPKSYSVGGQHSSRAAYRQARRHPARLQGSLVRDGDSGPRPDQVTAPSSKLASEPEIPAPSSSVQALMERAATLASMEGAEAVGFPPVDSTIVALVRAPEAQLTATTPALTREGEDEHTLSSEACAVNTRCPPKRVPSKWSADRFFSRCGLTMQPPKSYSVGGQGSSQASPQAPGQTTGVAGGAEDCVVCLSSPVSTVLTCGHACMCVLCADNVWNRIGTCPLCRKLIAEITITTSKSERSQPELEAGRETGSQTVVLYCLRYNGSTKASTMVPEAHSSTFCPGHLNLKILLKKMKDILRSYFQAVSHNSVLKHSSGIHAHLSLTTHCIRNQLLLTLQFVHILTVSAEGQQYPSLLKAFCR
ncbi:UNVERIFIED_CONTAM: hypothetical protein FKN15_026816 [Acipenser sinensis]